MLKVYNGWSADKPVWIRHNAHQLWQPNTPLWGTKTHHLHDWPNPGQSTSQLHEHDLPVISTAKVKTVTGRPLLPLPLVPQLREQCASWQRCCWGEQRRSGCQKQKKKKVIYYLFTLFPLKGFCHLWKSPEEKGKRFFFYLPRNIQHIIINYIANTLRQSPFEFFLSLNCTVLIYCLQEFFIYLFFPPLQPMKKRHI